MSEQSALKRNLTPLNIITALILLGGTIFLLQQPSALAPEKEPEPQSRPLFTLSGKPYTAEGLSLRYTQPLYQIEMEAFRRKQAVLQAAALELYIQQLAEKEQRSPDEVAEELFRTEPPAEEQIRAFYDANRSNINGDYASVREEIENYLTQIQRQSQQQALVNKLLSLKELSLHLEPPAAPQAAIDTSGFPAKGPADATVTLVEFADYQCPHCKRAHEVLKRVLKPYEEKIRFVYMDFPINRSGISRKIAEGAVCADQQGKFWDYNDRAFERQAILRPESAREIAGELALDLARFDACLKNPATAEKVKRSEQQAIRAGATGTPSFFLNGEKLELHDLARELPAALDRALASGAGQGQG